MVLSRNAIASQIERGMLKITPTAEIKEAAVKIHFSGYFGITQDSYHECAEWHLKPGEFILARSREKLELPEDLSGLYDTYTHLARRGITTHLGSSFVEPSFTGWLVLEVFNFSRETVTLQKDMRAGCVVFLRMEL